jgi:glycosyltransferase involved in cell wall biosynthesis
MTERVSAWVYLSEKNIGVFDVYERPRRLMRIPNGMPDEPTGVKLSREDLGIRLDAMVLCIASRAIPSKGWGEAVEITQTLNAEGHTVDLILLGTGPEADRLRALAPAHVHLIGQVSNVQDYCQIADVGMLPSYFVGESLPLALIEMMAKGLPLISSEIGEIPDLIGKGDAAAGLLVPLKDDGLDMAAFLDATRKMLNPDLRRRMGHNSRLRFDQDFHLDRMVDRYANLYDDVGARTWKQK